MSRFFDDKVLSDDQICEEACENGQVSPESRYNDYRNRLPFHYIEDGENDGYYYWTYGATMELSIILSDDVAWGEDKPVSEIEVDDELSETSENPVQNKVITKALNGKLDKSTEKTILDQAYIKTAAGDNSRLNISIEQLPLTLVERDIHGHVMTSKADSEGQAVAYEQLEQRVPAGGKKGQNLTKKSDNDYDTYWADPDDINSIEHITLNGEDVPVEDKTANIKVDAKTLGFESTNVAYTDKENTFTERQKFNMPYNPEDDTWYNGYIDASAVKVSKIKYDGGIDTGRTTNNEAILTSESLKLTRRINTQNGTDQRRIQLDLDGIKRAEYVNHVLANYGYIFPKTYPNQNVTLATIEDLNAAQSDYNQNDSTAPNYIKNRPFYEETTLTEVADFKVISGNLKEVGSEVTTEYNGERFTGTVTGETDNYTIVIGNDNFSCLITILDVVASVTSSHGKYEVKSGDFVVFNEVNYEIKTIPTGEYAGKLYISDGEFDFDSNSPISASFIYIFKLTEHGNFIYDNYIIYKSTTDVNFNLKTGQQTIKAIDPKFIKDMYYETTTETEPYSGTLTNEKDTSRYIATLSLPTNWGENGDTAVVTISYKIYSIPIITANNHIAAGDTLDDGLQSYGIRISTDTTTSENNTTIETLVKYTDAPLNIKVIHTNIHKIPQKYIPSAEKEIKITSEDFTSEKVKTALTQYFVNNPSDYDYLGTINSWILTITNGEFLNVSFVFEKLMTNNAGSILLPGLLQFSCVYASFLPPDEFFDSYFCPRFAAVYILKRTDSFLVEFKAGDILSSSGDWLLKVGDSEDRSDDSFGKLGILHYNQDASSYKVFNDVVSLPEWITLAQQRTDFAIPAPTKGTDLVDKNYVDNNKGGTIPGTGTSSIQQKADPKYNGIIKAATKNPYAKVLYPELTDAEPIGAIGDYAASFGGNSSVQAKRGIGGGTSSVTKGAYSQSLGDNTVTTPKASDSTAIGYQTTTDAPGAFTHGSYTVVMSQKYVEGMFDPSVEPGQGSSGKPTEPGTTPADTLEMDSRRGEAASAGGFNSYASGFAAEVDGVSNVADGHISKSSGRSNRSWSYLSKTDGKNSVVKPDQTNENATGEGSWANGDNIQIIGAKYAYSGGSNNIVFAGADNSFSYGEGLQVKHKNQIVLGQYNDSNNNDLFVFGVGTGNSDRKNAIRVSEEGKFYYGYFEVSNLKTTNDAVASLDSKLTPKITGNTTEITNLWKTLRDTNTNLNNLNEAKYDKTGGTISGNVIITGDLTVNGTQHINNTENLNVENAMIYSNAKGATLATNGGIGIKKNATDVYAIVYDPVSDSVKLGLGKSDANGVFTFNANEGQPVAIRDDSSKFNANHFIKWNEEQKKLVDSGYLAEDFVDVATQQTIAGMKTFTDEVHFGTTHFSKDLNVDNAAVKIFDNLKDLVTQYKADSIVIDNGTGSSAVQYVLTLPKETGTLLLNKFKYSTFGSSNDGDSWNLTDGTKNLEIKYQDANSHSSIFLEKDYIELSDINGTGSAKISLASNVITLDTVDSSDKHKIIRVNPDKVSIGNSTDTSLVEIDSLSAKFSNRPQVKDNGNYVNVALVDDLNNYVPTQSESIDKYYAQITNENGIISARIFQNGGEDVQNLIISKDGVTVSGKNIATADSLNTKVNKLAESLRNQAYIRDNDGNDTGLAYTYTDEGNTLALRNASGQVQVSTPLQDNDAANKKFVEDKLTALNIQNGTGNKSLQQVIDSDFTLVNINSDRTGQTIQSGAVGQFAVEFGGKSRSEGKRAFSAGTQTIASGNYSAAFGNNSISEGVNSFVEGSQNISRGNSSHAENANNLAAADNTHVEGVENTATHMGAHVQGYKNGSFGDYTHTEGGENVSSTTANVTYSHIGGYKNTMVITGTANPDASGGGSTPGGGESTSKPTEFWATFIDGAWNKASGTNSFTIGYWNQNYGNGTFIAGHNNIIYNNVETAMLFGRYLQGGRNCQVVFGENNLLNKDALLIVGNGTGVTGPNRFSNAFEVLKDGRAKVQTAPKEDNDVVRTLELNNVNARYVSTSILGG